MLSVVIKDNHEPNVIKLTYENLYRELKDIEASELLVADSWLDSLGGVKNKFVCFVEADCLVSSGYFSSQIGLFNKNKFLRRLAVMASSTAVNDWGNRFYGYSIGDKYSDGVMPVRDKKARVPYPVQIAYIPGAVIRTVTLQKMLDELDLLNGIEKDLVLFSTQLSLGFWRHGLNYGKAVGSGGCLVHINPNATYVTTEDYVNDLGKFDPKAGDLVDMFHGESI